MAHVFVMAGGFWQNDATRAFRLVSPSGKNVRPYVADTEEAAEKLFHSSKHHSHLYTVDLFTGRADLVRRGEPDAERRNPAQSEGDIVAAPPHIDLTTDQMNAVRSVCEEGEFSGHW